MERFDKFYRNFDRPPFAPVYYPTPEEFADPIAYVAKIRPEAEEYGVVKIVPPENFKPPFAIDSETFEFTPRIQRLNEIEAIVRERLVFTERLVHYWSLQGVEFKMPWVDNKYLDLFKLYKVITSMGGGEEVTSKKQWPQVAKKMCVKTSQGPSHLKQHFFKLVAPFVKNMEEKDLVKDEEDFDEDVKEESTEECSPTMQGRRRAARPQGRMMAGLPQPKKARMGITQQQLQKKKVDPMESVFCAVCKRGDDEDRLLLCEDCDKSIHTHCCDPPLPGVPKGEWRCPECVATEVSKIGVNFGFYDAQTKYNLVTFAEFANKFKTDYFGVNDPKDVPDDIVEKEFWRNVINMEQTVAVKYGADLITSKVGSGFPRKGEDHRGIDSKQRQYYANHAWNLNNLPVLKESVLSHIETGISGMMVPWVYVGMCFSTFCWHTEDHWTYSINYNHWGERKIWYGICGEDASKFENTVRQLAPGLTKRQRDLFHHMTTAVNPALLISKGVRIWTVHQNAGEFVITFPRAYHAGYNEGLNFAEAVNFAPIDWLKMGRLCVGDYALVRRFCVFSHDELVLKMVQACDKLGIAMSLAALDELMEISKRESVGRAMVMKSGVKKSLKENFEQIADDARVCRHCNTTVFLSALSCAHGRNVCLEHIDKLCNKCPLSDCVLKYRYTLEELVPMIHKLEERTTLYFEWKEQVDSVLNDPKQKPMLSAVENLLETARHKRFPHALPLIRLIGSAKACHNALERSRALLNGKIRTRVKTRIQRADTRLDLAGIRSLIDEMHDLPCDVHESIEELEGLLLKIERWQSEARTAIAMVNERNENSGMQPQSPDELKQLMKRGEDFDVRMDELEQLRKAVDLMEWRTRAGRLLAWEPTVGMEDLDDFATRGRWEVDTVLRLISDGSRLLVDDGSTSQVALLHSRLKQALVADSSAERFLSSNKCTEEDLHNLWQELRESDWCTAKGLDAVRDELVRVREVRERTRGDEITLMDASEVVEECLKSRVLLNSDLHKKLVSIQDKLEIFTRRISSLFQKPNSYYNLVEIIRDRDDLAALAEGQTMARYLHSPSETNDEWIQLDEFESIAEMKQHQCTLRNQQKKLIGALQTSNAQRSARETCVCAMDKDSNKEGGLLICILCRAKYHGVCCEWDPFLGRLPEGAFLCIRCLRGRRPCIEDVQAACNQAPQNSLEVSLVRDLLSRVRDCSREAMTVIAETSALSDTWTEDLNNKFTWIVESVLSCEVLDIDVFPKVATLLHKVYGNLLAQQKEPWSILRSHPARGTPLPVLFIPLKKGKRNAGGKDITRKDRKRNKAVYHEDDQTCSADTCLRPYSEQVGWIQCEAGCARWYHYVCVGQTVEGAKSISTYICHRCSSQKCP